MTPGLWMRAHAGFAIVTGDRERGENLLVTAQAVDAAGLQAIAGGFYGPVVAPLEKLERDIVREGADLVDDARRGISRWIRF